MRINNRKLKSFGDRLKKARKNAGFTQARLADKLDLSATYIGFIEQGQRIPSIKTADRIARVLGIKFSDLLD